MKEHVQLHACTKQLLMKLCCSVAMLNVDNITFKKI